MADVAFIDSSGLRVMIDAFRQGQTGRTRVMLRAPSRQVSLALGVSGLDKVLPVVADPPNGGNGASALKVPWPLVDEIT